MNEGLPTPDTSYYHYIAWNYPTRLATNKSYLFFATTDQNRIWRLPFSDVAIKSTTTHSANRFGFNLSSPNRLSPTLSVTFTLPYSQNVHLTMYNLAGHAVASFVNNRFEAGSHNLSWNVRNIPAGCYSVVLQAESGSEVKNVIMAR